MHQRRTRQGGKTTPQRGQDEADTEREPTHEKLRRDADSPDELDVPEKAEYFGTDNDGNMHYFSWTRWRVFEVDDETVVGIHDIEPGALGIFVDAVRNDVGWQDNRYSDTGGMFRHLDTG